MIRGMNNAAAPVTRLATPTAPIKFFVDAGIPANGRSSRTDTLVSILGRNIAAARTIDRVRCGAIGVSVTGLASALGATCAGCGASGSLATGSGGDPFFFSSADPERGVV